MKLVSWGANQYGQLAHQGWPLNEQCEVPQTVDLTSLPNGVVENLVQICGGGGHSLLLDADGRVWACGLNNKGQCGVEPSSATPPGNIQRPWHQLDTGFLRVTYIAAGWEHTLALTTEGILLGWGSGSHGQLGSMVCCSPIVAIHHNSQCILWQVQRNESTSKAVQVDSSVQYMSAGLRHSAWVTKDGKLKSCGSLEAKTIETPELFKARKVACGQRHTVALIGVDEGNEVEGQVWGWGDNRHGQLGCDPSTFTRSTHLVPAKLIENLWFADLKSGWSHAAGLTGAGQVVCWGRNTYGQLGTSPSDKKSELPVAWPLYQNEKGLDTKAAQIALGSEHTLVRLEDGAVLSCGWNEHGNCGTGDLTDLHTPQHILSRALLIGCGAAHSFAVIRDN